MIKSLLLIAVLSLFAGCAPKQPVAVPHEQPEPGNFFASSKTPVQEARLLKYLKDRDFILIGESHNNACDHRVQAKVMEMLVTAGEEIVIGLEMVSVERREILDMFNAGLIDTERLPDRLDWNEKWGFDFELYRPIFEMAREYDVHLLPLNLPPDVTRNISRHGLDSLSPEDRLFMPEDLIKPPPDQLQMLEDHFGLHEDFIQTQDALFKRFVAAQSAWDTKMALEAVRASDARRKTVVILAGTGHVDKGHGIEHRLRVYRPESSIARLVPVRSLEDISADNPYYYFCPPARDRMRLGIVAEEEGGRILITGVVRDSLAMQAGLLAGDEIVRAGEEVMSSLSDLHRAAVSALNHEQGLRLEIRRNSSLEVFEINFCPSRHP
jgi:uncharacterized iron-regulated protein